jgi:hypothetical protein
MGISEMKPTQMTIQLADASIRLPLGIVEDVLVNVRKVFVSGDFVVMKIKEGKEVSIILGRPFWRTIRVVAYIREGTPTVRIGDEQIQFQFDWAVNRGWGKIDEGEAERVNALNNNDFRPNDNNQPQNLN